MRYIKLFESKRYHTKILKGDKEELEQFKTHHIQQFLIQVIGLLYNSKLIDILVNLRVSLGKASHSSKVLNLVPE